MAWLDYGKNPTLAELLAQASPIHGGGNIPEYLLRPKRTWQDDLKDVANALSPVISSYIKGRRSDAVANEIMNMQQPPRAEAVDSSLQGDPATSPFSGGAQAYQAYLASQKMDDER